MDNLTHRSGSPLTEVIPDPGTTTGKKKKKVSAGSQNGRSVETKELACAGVSVSAAPTDKQVSDIKARHASLVNSQTLHPHLLEQSLTCINQFIKEKELETVELKYNLKTGYSSESKILLAAMADYKAMIDDHIKLFDKISRSITASCNPRKKMAVFRDLKTRTKQTLMHKNILMTQYSNLCQARLTAYQLYFSGMSTPSFSKENSDNYAVFISQTLELIQVYDKLLSIKNELGEEAKDVLEEYNKANELLVCLLAHAIPYYGIPENPNSQDDLMQIMSENQEYFAKWLQQIDPEKLTCFNIQFRIGSCIICGEMDTAQRLLEYFLQKVSKKDFIANDVFSLLINCKHSFKAFCESKLPCEDTIRINQAEKFISTLNKIVKKVVETQGVSTDTQESLTQKLQEEFRQPFEEMILRLKTKLLTIENTGFDLIINEEREAQTIQQKLEQRAIERRKRNEEAQKKHWLTQQSQAPEVSESTPITPLRAEEPFPPSIKEALNAFAKKASLNEILDILTPLINSPTASRFDKAQACYSYADMVKSRLSEQMKENYEHVCSIYEYGKAIREAASRNTTALSHSHETGNLSRAMASDLPEDDKGISLSATSPRIAQLPDPKMLVKFVKAIKTLSTMPSMYASIESMTQAFTQALDAISTEENLQPDFVDALNQLQTDIQRLITPMNQIADCCADAQTIYAERGALLKTHKKSGQRGKKKVNKKQNLNQNVQSLKSVSDELNRYLIPLNEKLVSSKKLMKDKCLPVSSRQAVTTAEGASKE